LLAGDQLSQEDDLDGASGLLIQGISRMITERPPDEDLASVWINVLAARGLLADGADKPDDVGARPCRGEPVADCLDERRVNEMTGGPKAAGAWPSTVSPLSNPATPAPARMASA
jgi:hypothetical protein